MKKIIFYFSLLIFCFLFNIYSYSQGISINTTGDAAGNSAILDVSSTKQGVLIPRMIESQRDSIPSPAVGLLIYNTTTDKFNYYKNTGWYELSCIFLSSIIGTLSPGDGTAINLNGDIADSSALLDVKSDTRGFLLPRTLPDSIISPDKGLIIFDISTYNYKYFNGSIWKTICETFITTNTGSGSLLPQGIAINTDGSAADSSSMLDVGSSSKGLLIPGMAISDRDLILPKQGLMIYENTITNTINFSDGNKWYKLVTDPPDTPDFIIGLTTICSGQKDIIYSVSPVPGASSYTWSVPEKWIITAGQGTNSITVNADSINCNISVTANNACGNGIARTLAVSIFAVPAQPSEITGPASPCQGITGLIYSISNVSGLSYTWTVPSDWSITDGQGTNSITVTAGSANGNISVTPDNACGNGIAQTLAVNTITVPAQTSEISGPASSCQGAAGLTYSITGISGLTYTWAVPSDWNIKAGQGTNSITVTAGSASGNIVVIPGNTCGNGTPQTLSVSVIPVPSQPSAITGPASPCQGTTGLTYSITNVSGVNYTWAVPPNWSITGGQGTNSITVTAGSNNGNISVTPGNACGNGIARTKAVSTTTVPNQPSVITGNVNPCQETTGLTYSVFNIFGLIYTWTVPTGWSITGGQGTNKITVTAGSAGGDISVTPNNICGNGNPQSLKVTASTIPAIPSDISGPASPCQGSSEIAYSVTNVSGVTYTWSVPSDWSITGGQGTSTVNLTVGSVIGIISVIPGNACGNGTAQTLSVITNTVPGQPSEIIGPATPCQGSPGLNYYTTDVSGVTYTWTVPPDWSITGGQGTNSITVTSGSARGNITVTPANICGNGVAQTIAVITTTVPAQTSSITGPASSCQGATGLIYSITDVIDNYTWSVPSGWSITDGQGTNSITVTAGSNSGNISVTPGNVCGNGTSRTLAVTTTSVPAQPSAITGPANPCQTTAGLIYSINNVSGITYTWTVPSDWSITGGQGTNSITVTAGTVNGNISVTPGNACGNGTSQTLAVTVSSFSETASITISASTNPVCSGTNVIFTATPTNGGSTPSYQWKLNGVNVGTYSSNSTYSNSSLINNDNITCVMTSNASCVSGSPAMSNTITMTVSGLAITASASVTPSNSVCAGSVLILKGGPDLMFSYAWSGPSSFNSNSQSPEPFTAVAGTYTVTVSDNTGCQGTASITVNPLGTCNCNLTVVHTQSSTGAPVNKIVTYITVTTNLSGAPHCWITQNLGADHQATSATDATEASAGWYFQWGSTNNAYPGQGHKIAEDGTCTPGFSTCPYGGSTPDPCNLLLGSGWRLPSRNEWTNVISNGGLTDFNTAFATELKLHAAGYYWWGGCLNPGIQFDGRGSIGKYWSNNYYNISPWPHAYALDFTSYSSTVETPLTFAGLPLRCLK